LKRYRRFRCVKKGFSGMLYQSSSLKRSSKRVVCWGVHLREHEANLKRTWVFHSVMSSLKGTELCLSKVHRYQTCRIRIFKPKTLFSSQSRMYFQAKNLKRTLFSNPTLFNLTCYTQKPRLRF